MDGLRALAILLVVVMHIFQTMPRFSFVAYGIEWAMPLYNGWAGVDLFFVISGYLIGGGILRNLGSWA